MIYNVVCAVIINNDDEVLIVKRKKSKNVPNLFEFPGGKVENETLDQATIREVKEELELDIAVDRFFYKDFYKYEDFSVNLNFCICHLLGGDIKLNVHTEYKWVKIDKLEDFDILVSNTKAVKKLMELY